MRYTKRQRKAIGEAFRKAAGSKTTPVSWLADEIEVATGNVASHASISRVFYGGDCRGDESADTPITCTAQDAIIPVIAKILDVDIDAVLRAVARQPNLPLVESATTHRVEIEPDRAGFTFEAGRVAVKQLESLGLLTDEVRASLLKKVSEQLGL